MASERTSQLPGWVTDLRRKSNFWISGLVLVSLVGIGFVPLAAAQTTTTTKTTKSTEAADQAQAAGQKRAPPKPRRIRLSGAGAQGDPGPRPRHRHGARDGRNGRPALQGRCKRRPGARPARCRGDCLQSRDQRSALGTELPEPALDRQHHQGDDRDRVPRERSRSSRAGHRSSAATSSRPRRPTCRPTTRSRPATCCTCC